MIDISRTVRVIGRVAAVVVLPAALLVAGATAAFAGACSVSPPGEIGGESFCTGVRTHRVFLLCEDNNGDAYTRLGPVAGPGQFSRARCAEFSFAKDVTVSFT